MLKKTSYYVAGLTAGFALMCAFFFLRGAVAKGVEAVLLAAGVSLSAGSGVSLFFKREERRHPEQTRREHIEYADERSVMIRERAKAKAGDIVCWLVMGIAYVLIWQDAPLWLTGLCVGVFCVYHLMTVLLCRRLDKTL